VLTLQDVSLPPAIARLCEYLLRAAHAGARWASRGLADGEIVRTRRIIARITMILRHVLLMIAVRLELTVSRARSNATPLARLESLCGDAPTFKLWSALSRSARHPVFAAGDAQDPDLPGFEQQQSLDPWLGLRPPQETGQDGRTLRRKLAAIRAALENPLRFARKIARALSNDRYVFLPPLIPRSTPPSDAQEFWEERVAAADEANFQYHSYWRRRRDSS
jgi:hypothetical protein